MTNFIFGFLFFFSLFTIFATNFALLPFVVCYLAIENAIAAKLAYQN